MAKPEYETLTHEQRELYLFIGNDGTLYRQMLMPILKNLQKKKDKSIYKTMGAIKSFQHLVNAGAKKYAKEFAKASEWNSIFSIKDRLIVSRLFESDFVSEYEAGNRY